MAWRRIWRCSRGAIAASRPLPELRSPRQPLLLPLSSSRASRPFPGAFPLHSSYLEDLGAAVVGRRFSSQACVDPPGGKIVDVPLAQTGEGIAECELLKWFVQEGDHVEEFQRLCEVQSDKATIEITSRFQGKVLQILFSPGDIVKVGETLLNILVKTETLPTYEGHESRDTLISELCESDGQRLANDEVVVGGTLSTPAVRHLAKQYGVSINDVCGTSKGGRILKEDVLNYAKAKGILNESPLPEHNDANEPVVLKEGKSSYGEAADELLCEDKTIPLRGFQRSMVKSMTMAAKVPHFHYLEEIDCDALLEIKTAFQNGNADPTIKHSFLPFLIKSLSMALNKYPLLNSSFSEESNEVILKGWHNVGVAMATPFGLVVPNIKKVQSLSIMQVTKELSRLQQLALNNKLNSEDIAGGTITISNIGAIGGKCGSPLLNLPEVAIVAIGRIRKLPRFDDDGTVYSANITNSKMLFKPALGNSDGSKLKKDEIMDAILVNIGADHRVVDGATVAMFCNEWKSLIEKPELLILHMK